MVQEAARWLRVSGAACSTARVEFVWQPPLMMTYMVFGQVGVDYGGNVAPPVETVVDVAIVQWIVHNTL